MVNGQYWGKVRGYDICIIQSTSFPINNHLIELLIMVMLANGQRKYCQCSRALLAPAKTDCCSKEPITAKLVANMLVKAGVDVVTLDLHAVQVQGFFDIAVDNLYYSTLQRAPASTKV